MKAPTTASSTTDCKKQPLLFQDLGSRKVVADFSGGTLSSDGGVLLVRQVDACLGLTRKLARCFEDRRDQIYVDHSPQQLLARRLYGMVLGCEDIHDHQRLRLDPLLAAACEKKDPSGSIRLRLLKVAARARLSVRRLYVQLSSAFPLQSLFRLCQRRLMAKAPASG